MNSNYVRSPYYNIFIAEKGPCLASAKYACVLSKYSAHNAAKMIMVYVEVYGIQLQPTT